MDYKKALNDLVGKDEMVSVFCNPDDEYKSCCGWIVAVSDEYFIMKSLTFDGYADGFLLRHFNEIFRIDRNCEYEQRLMFLYSELNQKHPSFDVFGEDLLVTFFEYARNNGLVVGVGVRDYSEKSIYGFVKEIDCENQTLTFVDLNDNGKETGGEYLITFDSVKRASISSEDEVKLQLLNRGFNAQ
jgi:hypothetical protein